MGLAGGCVVERAGGGVWNRGFTAGLVEEGRELIAKAVIRRGAAAGFPGVAGEPVHGEGAPLGRRSAGTAPPARCAGAAACRRRWMLP